jgi:hypothetical protein
MNQPAQTKKKAAIALTIIAIIAISSVMFLQKSQTTQAAIINPHPGLVGWWRFDEGSGTIASDSSGNGNTGTLQGSPLPSWVAGRYGDALQFNGANSVDCGNKAMLQPSPLSVFAWVKVSADGAWNTIVGCKNGNFGYAIMQSATGNSYRFDVFLGNSSAHFTQFDIATVPPNTWAFIGFTYDGTTLNCYYNGILTQTASPSYLNDAEGSLSGFGSIAYDSTHLTISSNSNGYVDEVSISNRALSAAEIQTDFQQSPDFSPYLLANVPKGTTQVITTLSWQGTGNINVTITTPSQTYTESMMTEYQKTTYSTTGGGPLSMLNIKRLSIPVNALPSAQSWNITLTYDITISAYQISVETQQ